MSFEAYNVEGKTLALAESNEEIDRLKAQLWKYGKHLTLCRLNTRPDTWCDCGWNELRETLAPSKTTANDAFSVGETK